MWNEIFRQYWQIYTKSEPIPVMKAWNKENHPFFKIYKNESGQVNMKRIFRKNTHFLDSKDSWEIRMADIVGTILHRYSNRGRCNDIGDKLMKHIGGKRNNYTHLVLNAIK